MFDPFSSPISSDLWQWQSPTHLLERLSKLQLKFLPPPSLAPPLPLMTPLAASKSGNPFSTTAGIEDLARTFSQFSSTTVVMH